VRAREFTINVPINIRIEGDSDPQIDMDSLNQQIDKQTKPIKQDLPDPDEAPSAMIFPQQQEIELKKAEQGKQSIAAAQLVDNPEPGELS
jgi:hypothetical protein